MGKFVQLTRPRIVLMVLFALAVSAWTCGASPPAWRDILHALIGTALITAGSVALNQWYEQRSDALMARTQGRPIPSGRVPSAQALSFGIALSLAGLGYLMLMADPSVALTALVSWLFYVACYTPLKSMTVWQLPVGAVAGAMPMVIGGAVAGVPYGTMSLALFTIVFLWQFPHAVAIAWIYRHQYARARLRVASVHDPSGQLAGILATVGAVLLLPASLLPVLTGRASPLFGVGAIVFGVGYLFVSVRFLQQRNDTRARRLLWASFAYLPAILVVLLVTVVR